MGWGRGGGEQFQCTLKPISFSKIIKCFGLQVSEWIIQSRK